MHDNDNSASTFPDILGIIGVAFAVVGVAMSDSPSELRITCLVLSALCVSLSFSGQTQGPVWIRLLLSLVAVSLVTYAVWSIVHRSFQSH